MAEPNNNEPDPLSLTSRTLTRSEWAVIARTLLITATIVDFHGGDPRDLIELHQRVMPEDMVAP